MKRKLAAIVLAIAMVFTMMPMTSFSLAYADEAVITFNLTDTDLEWDPVDGAAFYQINIFGQCMQDEDGGPDYYECSFPRKKIDKYIISQVISGAYEEADYYEITVEAGAEDSGLIGKGTFNYPSPVDGEIDNVNVDESGTLTWDDYFPGAYHVYANDTQIASVYEDCYVNLNDELEESIQTGILKKDGNDAYTIRIDDVVNRDDGEAVVASATFNHTYVTSTENPYFENIGWDEGNEYIVWDNAPFNSYVCAYIDGVKVDDFSSGTHIPTLIDKLVRTGKLDNTITDHEILVQAHGYAEGMDHTIYEWSTEYSYASEQEALTGFPEIQLEGGGLLKWSIFRGVDHFRFSINEFVCEDYGENELLFLYEEIDSRILHGELVPDENDSYHFILEAIDESGEVLDTYENTFEYKPRTVPPADEFYYLEVDEEDILRWNDVNGSSHYELYVNDSTVNDCFWDCYYRNIGYTIDSMIREERLEKAEDNVYTFTVKAMNVYYDDDYNEVFDVLSTKSYDYYHETNVMPAQDDFVSVELCMDEDSNYYRQLVWNDIKNVEHYEVEYCGKTETCYGNNFGFCDWIDQMIEEGRIDSVDSYDVTITAYDYEGNALATRTITVEYQSQASVPFKVSINDGILTWQGTEGGSYIKIMANDVWISEMISVDAESVDIEALIDQAIINNVIDKKDYYNLEVGLYNDEEGSINWYSYYDFEYSSDAVPNPLPLIDAELDPATGVLTWNEMDGAETYTLIVSGYEYTNFGGAGDATLSNIIDDLIICGDIDKSETDDYIITLIAKTEDYKKVGKWEGTLHYETEAEPIPDVDINAQIDVDTGTLTWEESENATDYEIFIYGWEGGSHSVYYGQYLADGITLRDKIDKLVREVNGFKDDAEQDGYEVNVSAYTYNEGRRIRCGHWNGRFAYDSPYEYLPPAYINADFDDESGLLTWDEPEDATVDHYVIYIENCNIRITEFTGRNVNVYEALTAQGFDGEWLNIYVIGEDAEGIRVARSDSIEGYYRKPVAELTEDDVYIDSNGYLVAKPYEGADYYRFVLYYTDSEGNESQTSWEYDYIEEIQSFNVNEYIDRTIKGNKEFKNTGIFDVGFQVIERDYGLMAERRWSYEYDTDAEYIPPVEMQLNVANGWITSDYTGADHYELCIELPEDSWRYQYAGEDELNFFLAGWINVLIDGEDIDAGSKHNIEVNAYKDGVLVANGKLPDYLCKVTEIPELSGITYDEESGVLSWNEVENAEWYSLIVNGFRATEIYSDDDCKVNICSLIDSMIRYENITKADSYKIEISAMNQGFHIADGTYNLIYDSPAEPPVEFELSFENGILSWEPVDGAYEYLVYINDRDDNNRDSFYIEDNTSVEIDKILDLSYTAEKITEDSEHIISVIAYNTENDPIGKGSGNYTYTPKEYIPQEITGIVCDEYGDITWDKPEGATGYTFYINGQEIEYYTYGEEARINDIKKVIDRQIRREKIEVSEEDTYKVTINAYALHDTSMVIAVGSIVIDYDSPATPPVEMSASINDGVLSWEPMDGVNEYEIGIENRGGGSWISTRDTQINLDKLIDLMYTYKDISADGNLTVYLRAYNNSYDPLGKWESEYKHTPETFTVQELSGSKYDSKTGVLSWNKVNDADGYSISINGRSFYWADENELSVNVNRIIDSQIRRELIERPNDNKYEIVINAICYGRYIIADGSVAITYDSPARPPAPMTASLDDNGILTWEPVEGAYNYRVVLGGEITLVSTKELSVDLYEVIDNAYTRGWIGNHSDFTFELYAYNDDYEPIGKTEVKVYHTPEEIEETVVKSIDITGYLNEILAGDIVRYDTKIGQTEPANAKIEKTGEGWYYNDIFQEGDDTDRVPVAGDIYKHTIDLYAELGYKFADDLTVTYNGIAVDLGIRRSSDYSLELVRMVEVQPDEANIADADIGIVGGPFTYTGKAITPEVTVIHKGRTLVEGTDYTAAYSENTNAGTATIKITGKGRFTGTESVNFDIGKASQKITGPASTIKKTYGNAAFSLGAKTNGDGKLTYSSNKTSVATVTSAGKVTIKGVGTATITISAAETKNYKPATKKVTIKVVPKATTSLTASNLTTGVKLTWKKVTGATGYKVYKGSTLIKKITSGSTVTYTYTKANTNGTKYTFKVVPYASSGDGASKSVIIYRLSRPAISSLKNSASKKATVKWGKNTKATGYEIWYSTSKSFSTKKTATVTKNTTVSKTLTKLTKGKTYYVKVRSYKTVSGKKYYSAWSAVKTVKITK